MRSKLTVGQFYQDYKKSLKLSFLSSQVGLDREIQLSTSASQSFEAVDYLNVVRPSSVALIGHQESQYLKSLSIAKQQKILKSLYNSHVKALVLSHNEQLNDQLIQYSEENQVPVFYSDFGDAQLLEHCRFFLSRALAEHTVEHGVFIEVYSVGIFIRGDSGIGKSELALALISRGHRLIADDVTRFTHTGPDVLDGHSPGLLADFMEVRGLGIVNIRAMFGSNAVKRNKTLRLIINLSKFTNENKHEFERLGVENKTYSILGIETPQISLPVASGRNIAVLVEAAARNHLLNMNGYNAAEDFIERQRAAIKENTL